MQGFALKNVCLSAYEDDKLVYKELGEMLFTHFGVSGPLVLSASSHMRNMGTAKYRLEIDLKPALDEKKLDARLLRDFEKYSNKEFKNALGDLAGRTMIPVLIELSGIPEDTKVNTITREQRMKLLHLLKAFPVSISGTRPIDEAIVTAGGVSTKEVNPRTMESKLVPGLYFAGEVLDLDGYTGGFNLQIAWSTGFVAGNSILKEEY
jgi:predicted Rossmann fold flavoprotein